MTEDTFFKNINKISKQFLCNVPLLHFNWQNIFDTFPTETQQEYLLTQTINSRLVEKYPLPINYQKLFLKHIVQKLEHLQTESTQETTICDGLYSAYARLVAENDCSQQNYKHYALEKESTIITLKESNNLISDGTTGLRTWQAALALSEWIILERNFFNKKTVLELGAGIGLTGIVLKVVCSPKAIFLTDCHKAVLDNLRYNIQVNTPSTTTAKIKKVDESSDFNNLESRCIFRDPNIPEVAVFNLPWEHIQSDICKDMGPIDTVIAADIVYDKDLFKPLVDAISNLKDICKVQKFIFACTERNPDTLQEFLSLMGKVFVNIDQLPTPLQLNFVWPDDTPIKIYQFKD